MESNKPLITHLLARKLWRDAQTPKPTALGTPLRYSSAYSCSRQQGYAAFEAEPTEPMDESGAWVTGLGTIVHEALQAAIKDLYHDAEFEVPSGTEYLSGSCDALIPSYWFGSVREAYGSHVVYELKTMGTYSFDKQVGWKRQRGEWSYPEGPARKAIAQAGMNALGIEAGRDDVKKIYWVVMGSLTFEALSKMKADKMGVEDYQRFMGEWWIPREEWEPIAMEELKRMSDINESLTHGYLPERAARDDGGRLIFLNPNGSDWQCQYCAFRTLCLQDGVGEVWINDSVLTRKEKEMADATERR